ncbi:MAG: hypothetical protein BWY78_00652 [Alphaproteobacteria bacterium ADurb.Bin438]|nr:MAG: hypothetical protein BWY78_00652 [Alphaproteobacteria bacterium ADurb.Bin438]
MKSLFKFLFYVGLISLVCFSVFVLFYEIPSETTTETKEITHEINS